ncbi:unnamed protein product [Mycena citricolor]|uniref:DUF6534 domain-containing protein n=1 Tax=Mycena citricolor TaxID=2018698 RepID=A0AAD2I052_9AGAR|nr:unnamed protein product [Mycena citricolor]
MARTNLYNTLGAYEIGLALSTLLFGVESLQTFYYYRRYAKDPLVLKILVSPVSAAAAAAPLRLTARTQVAVIWIFGLTQSICAWHALFLMSVTFFGQEAHITTSPPNSLTLNALVSTVLFVLVQGFFCLRIRTVSGSRALAAGCFALALLPLVLYAYVAALLFRSGFAATADPRGPGHVVMTVAAAVLPLANILVSAVLCWGLWRMRGQRTFQRTNSIIDTIILWTVETTAITSVVAVLELIMDITAGKTRLSFEHSGFYILIHSAAVLWIIFFFLHGKRKHIPIEHSAGLLEQQRQPRHRPLGDLDLRERRGLQYGTQTRDRARDAAHDTLRRREVGSGGVRAGARADPRLALGGREDQPVVVRLERAGPQMVFCGRM